MVDKAIQLYDQGYYYYSGTNGYPKDIRKAYENFKASADLGNSDAMNYLGIFYENGFYVPKNLSVALDYFSHAYNTNKENIYAIYHLARFHYHGIATEKDPYHAQYLCSQVISILDNNNSTSKHASVYANAWHLLGNIALYYKNEKEAVGCYEKAVKYGNLPEAWHNLGWLRYKNVFSSSHHYTDYYEKAAELGYGQSMDEISRFYCQQVMIYQHTNRKKYEEAWYNARHWCQKAINAGYAPAKKRLQLLNALNGSAFDVLKALNGIKISDIGKALTGENVINGFK